jgi:hypothetical protein
MNKPASLNHPRASAAAIACLSLCVSARSSAAPVRAGAERQSCCSFDQHHSRGEKSGASRGKNTTFAPAASIAVRTTVAGGTGQCQDNQCAYPPLRNQNLLAVAQAHVGIVAADKAHREAVIQPFTERGATL